MSKETKFQSVASFCAERGITAISPVDINKNGYAFVTMVGEGVGEDGGGAENIYFSQAQAKLVKKGQEPSELGLASLQIAHTENADGELRLKISGKGESRYTDVSELF